MSVRFIIGRAGTGKTHYCMEAIRAGLRADAIRGPRLVFLVPEQAGLQMERAIIDPAGGCGGAYRADVVSFQRLAARVLADASGVDRVALTELARAMVLRHLLAENASSLKYYSRSARGGSGAARVAGLVDRLSHSIAELIEEGVEPSELLDAVGETEDPSAVGETEDSSAVSKKIGTISSPLVKEGSQKSNDFSGSGNNAANPAQRAKMHDLALIYRSYLDFLGERLLDPTRRLELARAHFSDCDWLHGARVWVDGFASLSGLELGALIELAKLAESVEVTLLADPACLSGQAGSVGDAGYLFAKTVRMYGDLHRAFTSAGLHVEAPVILAPDMPPRFSTQPSLVQLERTLFSTLPADEPTPHAGGAAVQLFEASSRRVEVDYAVSQVCRWVQDDSLGYRYRDIAIVTRDLDQYHDLMSEALTARHIPYFVDRRRPVSYHPLVELLRTLLAVAVEGMSLASMREWLKCGLVPIPDEALDELENYLIAHGVEGVPAWSEGGWTHDRLTALDKRRPAESEKTAKTLVRVNATRDRVWAFLGPWIEDSRRQEAMTGTAWHEWLIAALDRLDASGQLAQWAADAESDGDLDLAEEHREVWKQIGSLLDDFRFSFSNQPLTAVEVRDVLEAGMSSLTLGLTPPMIDQVLVGSIERSRHPNIKAIIVLGLNDGVFPKRPSEDSIFNDDDRERLLDHGVRIGLPSRRRVIDESMLVYIAMTRASERIVTTWSTTDEEGKPLLPSPYVEAIEAALPEVGRSRIDDQAHDRSCWDVLSACDLPRRLAQEFRERPVLEEDDPAARTTWNELYMISRQSLSTQDRRSLSSLCDDRGGGAKVDPSLVSQWLGCRLQASVSSLETYATCPFQFFSKHVLRLRERQLRELAPTDSGTLHHAVLEDFFQAILSRGDSVSQMSETELVAGLNESCEHIGAMIDGSDILSGARDAYVLGRSAELLGRVIGAQRRTIKRGTSRAARTEAAFGFGDQSLPALTIHTPHGHQAELRGFIDRVDLAEVGDDLLGIVVDYKQTKDKRLKLSEVYHGLSLQLLGYLLVLAEHGETLAGRPIKPGGALYVGLTPQYKSVPHPSKLTPREAVLGGMNKPRGLLSESAIAALDGASEGGWSECYQVFRKKTGGFGHLEKSDVADSRQFQAALDHTRRKMGELVDGILDGEVSVKPYRLGSFSPCSWCKMVPVCRFEIGVCDIRRLDGLPRSDELQRLAGTSDMDE